MSKFFWLPFIIAVVSIFSCGKKKEQWKLPTKVSFKMDIDRSASANGQLVFSNGSIRLADFRFDGKREQGDDVYFTKPFSSGLNIAFNANNTIAELNFDIPQGTYNKISVSFQSFSDTNNCLSVSGIYKNPTGTDYPIVFEFKKTQYFSIVAENNSGSNQIVLDKDVAATATIILNPVHWFQIVPFGMFNSAALTNMNGRATILINENLNDNIYNLVISRLNESVKVIFQ